MAARAGRSSAVTMLLSMGAEIRRNAEELHLLDLALKHEHKDVCVAVISHDRYMCIFPRTWRIGL